MEEKVEKEEEKVETKKKKKGIPKILYWIIVIVGLTFIYFMSYRIGQKIAEKDDNNTNNNQVSEKSNSNENSNVTNNETSNETSNPTSNVTSNENTNTNTTYHVKDFAGTFVSEEENLQLQFSTQATYLSDTYGVPACGAGKLGNFVIEDNKIYMYPLVATACDDNWTSLQGNPVIATIVSKDELQVNGKSYKRTDSTSLNEADGGLRYGISVLEQKK